MTGCPKGWADAGDNVCAPPESYDGLCGSVDVVSMANSEKEAFAKKCRASWPCAAPCAKDFSACPKVANTGVGQQGKRALRCWRRVRWHMQCRDGFHRLLAGAESRMGGNVRCSMAMRVSFSLQSRHRQLAKPSSDRA